MAETKSTLRPIHWALKLLLTVLVGGPFAIGAFFIPADAMPSVIPRTVVGPLCVAILVFSTTSFATLLHLRECNSWRRSLLMGVVVGLVGSAIILMVAFLFVMLLLSKAHFV